MFHSQAVKRFKCTPKMRQNMIVWRLGYPPGPDGKLKLSQTPSRSERPTSKGGGEGGGGD